LPTIGHQLPKRLDVLFGQLHEQPITAAPAPAIALDTADEPLAVVVDFDQQLMAGRAKSQ
jgi:hypothetical protein